MLDRFSVYYAGFTAGHTGGIGHAYAGAMHPHGHDWRVVVTARGDESQEVADKLAAIVDELRGMPLEKQMPGASTSAVGIASWIMERLGMQFAEIVRVDATCVEHTGYVEREARRSL